MAIFSTHQGYMDGINGVDPVSTQRDYENGWLAGSKARDEGKTLPEGWDDLQGIKQWDVVLLKKGTPVFHETGKHAGKTIPLKRATKVTVIMLHKGYEAYPETNHVSNVEPPQPAAIHYAGSGGYWRRVLISDVQKIEG